ncbi:MAG: DUF4974 domain-containing protein, partial [Bacteroidota bacterium]
YLQLVLSVGQRVFLYNGVLACMNPGELTVSWISGEERFLNDELRKVIKVLESRYNVTVDAGSISLDRKFTGTLPADDLQKACKIVFSSLGIRYEISQEVIKLLN